MNVGAIPMKMRLDDTWVATDGSKIPLTPNTYPPRPASSSDPSTWGTFLGAVETVCDGFADSIGYVFHDNGLVGIDIDAGYDEDGLMTPLAADIIGRCESYTECSRSGRGFHIILRGDLPFNGRNNLSGVEIYKSKRYFIMTGDVLLYREIRSNQPAIDYVLEHYFQTSSDRDSDPKMADRIYSPQWELPREGRVRLRPVYPRIPDGSRNICLTSLAGMLHNLGYSPQQIYEEISYANISACDPCLPDEEVKSITRSVTRYKR